MTEETTTPTPEAPAKGDAKPKRDYKKEQKPIEELYDLSQPIPQVRVDGSRTHWNVVANCVAVGKGRYFHVALVFR